ncbi:MAG: hypothetical protein ACR65T_00025 [Methylocystis sp.]|uniref:hypothetical protein n=1 Tax=Methylocystis sp. TaxID=1911079 RepID=UPI003DA68DCC
MFRSLSRWDAGRYAFVALPISSAKRELASLMDTRSRRLTSLIIVVEVDSADRFIGDAFRVICRFY